VGRSSLALIFGSLREFAYFATNIFTEKLCLALRFVEQVNYMFCTSAAKSNPLKIGYFDQTPKWNTQEIASKKGNPVARANQTLTAIYA